MVRRVLIVSSAGMDSLSRHTLEDVEKKIEGADVLVYGLGLGSMLRGRYEPYLSSSTRMNLYQARAFINMLADKSGGEAWFPNFAAAFPEDMKGITRDLQHQYRLVCTPRIPHENEFHKIKAEAFSLQGDQRVHDRVRVRDGWRY